MILRLIWAYAISQREFKKVMVGRYDVAVMRVRRLYRLWGCVKVTP